MKAPFRLNVALTRAQDTLVIIYDAVVVNSVDMWNRFSRSVKLEKGLDFIKNREENQIKVSLNPDWIIESIK